MDVPRHICLFAVVDHMIGSHDVNPTINTLNLKLLWRRLKNTVLAAFLTEALIVEVAVAKLILLLFKEHSVYGQKLKLK